MRRWPRPYLEPQPTPRPSEWWLVLKFIVYAWLTAHAFVDFVLAIRWFAERP